MRGSRRGEGDRGSGPALKITKTGSLINTGPDPLKNYKATKPAHSMLGHHRLASETPCKWRFAGGPMMGRGISILSLIKKKKRLSELDPLCNDFLDPCMYWLCEPPISLTFCIFVYLCILPSGSAVAQ